jgi:hypothetical protein
MALPLLLKCRLVAVASKRRETNVAALGNHWASKVCLANVMSVKLLSHRAPLIAAQSTFVERKHFAAMPREALQSRESSVGSKRGSAVWCVVVPAAETSPPLKR